MSILLGDFHYLGSTDSKGQIKKVEFDDALTQSIKFWIASEQGDVVNFPDRGGYVYELLLRPMKETDIDEVEGAIRLGIERDFFPFLEIISLNVEANFEQRFWRIDAVFYSPDLNYQLNFTEKIRNQV